tara:strand:+ start:179 stop:496 length:318 start_codon:yes stop_codon:yes gene_type:complete
MPKKDYILLRSYNAMNNKPSSLKSKMIKSKNPVRDKQEIALDTILEQSFYINKNILQERVERKKRIERINLYRKTLEVLAKRKAKREMVGYLTNNIVKLKTKWEN